MAYYALHAYDADVRIPGFVGLNQSDEIAVNLAYAMEAENVETPRGVLQPQAGLTLMDGQFTDRVETIARFHRRWYTGRGTNEWLVCASGGKVYCRQADDRLGWVEIQMPQDMTSFQSNVWSWVTYEQNIQGVDHPIDVLLMSNKYDGMYVVIPPDRPTTWGDLYIRPNQTGFKWGDLYDGDSDPGKTWGGVWTEKWTMAKVSTTVVVEDVSTEYKFGVIERYKERLWATDIITEITEDNDTKEVAEPDLLMYSTIYDPTNWQPYDPSGSDDPDEPGARLEEDCPGEIRQPSWDGDKFTALKRFGDQLIAFKGTRVWRVMGTSPGDFQMVEQYGGGTLYPNTIAVEGERILMVEKDGLSTYDGMTVSPFRREAIEQLWRTVNKSAMDQMCGAIFKQKYYLSVPTGDSEVNNMLIVFNMEDGSFLTYPDSDFEALMPALDILYATSSTEPGKVYEINYNSWETGLTSGKKAKWTTPWMDFNYKSMAKGGYEIYFNPEVKKYPISFRFSIQTEKKTKSKTVVIEPTLTKQKQKRIRFGGACRKFRLTIEALPAPSGAVWRLVGGIHMVVETDPD